MNPVTLVLEVGLHLTVRLEVGAVVQLGYAALKQQQDGLLRLSWPARGPVKLPLAPGREVQVEAPDPDGLICFLAQVVGREGTDVLLQLRDDSLTRVQRRRHVRAPLAQTLPVQLVPDAALGFTEPWAGVMTDMSEGGCRVELGFSVFEGLEVELVVAGGAPRRAAIIWCKQVEAGSTLGLRYL